MPTRRPTHPGEVFLEDVIRPIGVTITDAAASFNQHSSLSPEMAVRIATATDTSPESWIDMQSRLDLWHAQQKHLRVQKFPKSAASG